MPIGIVQTTFLMFHLVEIQKPLILYYFSLCLMQIFLKLINLVKTMNYICQNEHLDHDFCLDFFLTICLSAVDDLSFLALYHNRMVLGCNDNVFPKIIIIICVKILEKSSMRHAIFSTSVCLKNNVIINFWIFSLMATSPSNTTFLKPVLFLNLSLLSCCQTYHVLPDYNHIYV